MCQVWTEPGLREVQHSRHPKQANTHVEESLKTAIWKANIWTLLVHLVVPADTLLT